jgi:rhodanese-related sulfurtransferase
MILDVRIPSDWQESREKIKGAMRQVPGQVEIWGPSLPKDKKIVVYCD